MKRLTGILLLTFVFLCLVQACAALTYEGQITTSPSQVNALKPGDTVSEVSGTLDLPGSGDQTFPMDDTLEFYTQLDGAKWAFFIVVNGVENPYQAYGTATRKTILGTDLTYINTKYEVKVKFSMTGGTVPSSFKSGKIILVRALEINTQSSQVGNGVYVNGTVISTEALSANVSRVDSDLTNLKADIDAKSNAGVDVTIPLQKYNYAKNALDNAKNDLITAPTQVQDLLDTATTNINDGRSALDQAWAKQSLDAAKGMIASVDGLLKEFTVNRSLKASDPRLVPITNKFDLAVKSKNDAQNLFDQGTYNTARSDSTQALGYANEAWNLSLTLKGELDQGFSLGLPNLGAFLPFLVVVAVVLIIAGVIIYRKKTQWDELG
jgi:hypothetical protein